MNKEQFQIVYGIVLIAVGVGVFLKIPYVMPNVVAINYFTGAALVIKLSFYLLGGLIVLAGATKIFKNLNKSKDI